MERKIRFEELGAHIKQPIPLFYLRKYMDEFVLFEIIYYNVMCHLKDCGEIKCLIL